MDIERMEISQPGMIPSQSNSGVSSANYRVRYYTADLTDEGAVAVLEGILTQGLDGKNIVIIDKDKYSFQDRYFVVVAYLEKR